MIVKLTSQAENDVAQAFRWYERKREGLGVEFLNRVDEAIEIISSNPTLPAKLIGNARRTLLEQFPFAVWYVVTEEAIVIGCIHSKRDPSLARKRMDGPKFT